jgi:hypothetical protein
LWYLALESHRQMRDLEAGGLRVLPAAPPEVRRRMEDMCDFLTYYLEEHPKMYARWLEKRHKEAE